ncbi:MAG: DNA translocase FtsK [Deltaproteobacteria bacterium]|nr:DNA translocase FtsK [Deltaproteobacteria bacterium]
MFSLAGIRSLWLGGTPCARPTETHQHAPGGAPPEPARSAGERRGKARRHATEEAAGTAGAPAPEPEAPPSRRRTARSYAREAAALLLIAAALYAALALASYRADPLRSEVVGPNWVGPVGAVLADLAVGLLGVAAWLIPIELVLVARPLLADRPARLGLSRLAGNLLIAIIAAALVHIGWPRAMAFGARPVGGLVGDLFGEIGRGLFSSLGSFLIGTTIVALVLVERAAFSFIELMQRAQAVVGSCHDALARASGALRSAWIKARALERAERAHDQAAQEPVIASPEQADAIIAACADDGDPLAPAIWGWAGEGATGSALAHASPAPVAPVVLVAPEPVLLSPWSSVDPCPLAQVPPAAPSEPAVALEVTPSLGEAVLSGETPAPGPRTASEPARPAPSGGEAAADDPVPGHSDSAQREGAKRRAGPRAKETGPRIVDTSAAARTEKSSKARGEVSRGSHFQLPTTGLLDPPVEGGPRICPDALKETARLLEKTLLDYGVQGRVEEIHPGPTVTTFEVTPAAGTKVSKVARLADDLALGLSRKVRIVAPIPGKNRVGFEVPNEHPIPVNLRELIEDRRFLEMKAPLPCVLGRDIIGTPVFADLAAMPHVIVAGATGAGKSVGLNVMLVSLLYRRTPAELRLLLIDPKVVELAPFDRIPHLLFPVITDMKHAANGLKWAVDEMERRYQLFADIGTRNIKGYNAWAEQVLAGTAKPRGSAARGPAHEDAPEVPPEPLPFIVIVVEEFADLMMQQAKDVEAAVARLAQKARAAGMHLIVATQRPSVDVITGMIKANFNTRIAYRVVQKVDSSTILDERGAEQLLGRGDMLVRLNGTSEARRVQCPFVSEEEVQRVTEVLRAQGEPQYDESIIAPRGEDEGPEDFADAENDPLYDQAVRLVAETRRCSTSWIQRKLGIGYNRAAKIVETMERQGLVGPPNGAKDREILISAQ